MSMKRIRCTVEWKMTHLFRSRESIISRCFSRRAFVAPLPACVSSSSRLVPMGVQSVLAFRSPTTRDVGATATSGMDALMAAFCMSTNSLLIFLTTLTKSVSACATGSCSSVLGTTSLTGEKRLCAHLNLLDRFPL
jgi:hypothetical protein